MILLTELNYISTGDTLAERLEKAFNFLNRFSEEILSVSEKANPTGKKVAEAVASAIIQSAGAALSGVRRVYQSEKNNTFKK